MNKNDYKEWLKYFVAMYQCIYINIFLCKHLLFMPLTLHSKIDTFIKVSLLSSRVVNEKLSLLSPISTVSAKAITQYCTKGCSPVTFAVSSEASVMLTLTPELSLESVKDKMYRRITPLGDSGASHWKTA